MWPTLVASKILRKRLGSNKFVQDFPNIPESLLDHHSTIDQRSLSSSASFTHHEYKETFKVFVSTWNVGGVAPTEDLDVEDFLDTCNTCFDIYVIGFQEVVPLRAKYVLGFEDTQISMKWNSLIREALNKKTRKHDKIGEFNTRVFHCIISKQMVGLLISVWIRSDLHPYVQSPNASCVGCGIMGCLGNKGSVSVRFQLHETSFCFVCSHLASGNKQGDERQRKSNVSEIFSRTTFPRGPSHDLPRKILDHDCVIFLGDLNYRISLPESITRSLIGRGEWNTLLDNDQLRVELMEDQVFEGWHEGPINFPPTYKYYPNSDAYYGCLESKKGCLESKKGEKKRLPAWCDRIIWFGQGLKQHLYTRGETKLSDHRPVKAVFTAEVRISRKMKRLNSFFLSEV